MATTGMLKNVFLILTESFQLLEVNDVVGMSIP
jgi:hypothetical protein